MSEVKIRPFEEKDAEDCRRIWNEVVEEGNAFPQTEGLKKEEALSTLSINLCKFF